MKNNLIAIIQALAYILFAAPFRLLLNINRHGTTIDLVDDKVHIIAANHLTRLDAFIICSALKPREYFKLLPIRLVTAEHYMKKLWLRLLIIPLGSISDKAKKDMKITEVLKNHLKKGETLLIFPSGRRTNPDEIVKPKVGVAYLERDIKNAMVIPMKIEIYPTLNAIDLLKRNLKIEVIFKEPYRHDNFPDDLQPVADEIMAAIMK